MICPPDYESLIEASVRYTLAPAIFELHVDNMLRQEHGVTIE